LSPNSGLGSNLRHASQGEAEAWLRRQSRRAASCARHYEDAAAGRQKSHRLQLAVAEPSRVWCCSRQHHDRSAAPLEPSAQARRMLDALIAGERQ